MSNGEIRVSITEIPKIREALEKADKEIERLNKERNKTYENGLNYFLELQEKKEEVERLNNIIKRLEEFIEKEIELYTVELTEENKNKLGYTAPIRAVYKEIYNILQELKGEIK